MDQPQQAPSGALVQFQVLSPKLTSGGPGCPHQVGRCPPKSAPFRVQKCHFLPKTALEPIQNGQTKGNGSYTPRVA